MILITMHDVDNLLTVHKIMDSSFKLKVYFKGHVCARSIVMFLFKTGITVLFLELTKKSQGAHKLVI